MASGNQSLSEEGEEFLDFSRMICDPGRHCGRNPIRAAMHEGGLSYTKATAALSNRATYGDQVPELKVHDPLTRAKLHTEAMRRVEESKKNAAGSDGRIKAIGFSDALGSIFSDIAKGEPVEGFGS